jgi:hypothetical protein
VHEQYILVQRTQNTRDSGPGNMFTGGRLDKLGWIMLKAVPTHFCVKVTFFAATKGKRQ